jgi:hypothetical protein
MSDDMPEASNVEAGPQSVAHIPSGNDMLATAVRTLLSAGILVDSALRKAEFLAISCHRIDDLGVSIPYLVVLSDGPLSVAGVAAARTNASHDEHHLVIVSDEYDGDEPHASWSEFLARLGGPLKSYLPLSDDFASALQELGHFRLPAGLNGQADTIFEEYVLAGLQFMLGNRVIRYGQDRRFERVPDGIAHAGDPPVLFIYDAKAAGDGFLVDAAALRQFGDYVRSFNRRYESRFGAIRTFLVVSGHFDMTEDMKSNRADELFADCGARLSFLTSDDMSAICSMLKDNITVRSALPWHDIVSRLNVVPARVADVIGAVQRDGLVS